MVDLTEPSEAKPVVIDLTGDVSTLKKTADLSERSFLDVQALRRQRQALAQVRILECSIIIHKMMH